ncbi:MAG TPA: hypothetical protein VK464_19865 [Symbiobacteriaceae bacterium]|nr:hypothetical protein [Symbiobacteriaceae bacterium]
MACWAPPWGWGTPLLRRRLLIGVLSFVTLYWVGYRGIAHRLVEHEVAALYAGQPVAQTISATR